MTRSDVLWPLLRTVPNFSPSAPPIDWEEQHASPRGYCLGNKNDDIATGIRWYPGAKPVPRLASHHYANYRPPVNEFYFA